MFASRKKSKLCYLPDSVYIIGRLIRYQNAIRRFEEIGAEMQQDYQSDNSVRVKRLAKEPGALPEAKKSLKKKKFEEILKRFEKRDLKRDLKKSFEKKKRFEKRFEDLKKKRFEEIGAEMQQDYQSDNSVRVKRLAKEPGALPEAKKSLKFGDTASIETQSCYIRSGNNFYILRHNACHSLLLELLADKWDPK